MSYLTVSATKPSRESRVGIGLKNTAVTEGTGGVYVSAIRENSIFQNTELRKGMIIESINGINCTFLTSSDAANILRRAESEVSIVARSIPVAVPSTQQHSYPVSSTVTVVATKPNRNSKVGIRFETNFEATGGLRISKVEEDGMFASTLLREGMTLQSINGVDCVGMTSSADADRIMREAEGEVTLVALEVLEHSVKTVPTVLFSNNEPEAHELDALCLLKSCCCLICMVILGFVLFYGIIIISYMRSF